MTKRENCVVFTLVADTEELCGSVDKATGSSALGQGTLFSLPNPSKRT